MSNRRKTRTKWLKASTVLLVGAFLVTIGWQNRLSLSFAVGAAMIAWAASRVVGLVVGLLASRKRRGRRRTEQVPRERKPSEPGQASNERE